MATFETQCGDMARVVSAAGNATATSFLSTIPTTTKPTIGDRSTSGGVIQIGSDTEVIPNNLLIVPFGVGNDTNTFVMRILGWRATKKGSLGVLWIPILLGEFTCTLTTATGVAGAYLVVADKFCDTIAVVGTSGNANVDYVITSPTGDLVAHLTIDLKGCRLVEFQFDMTGATSGNALYVPF